MKRKKGCAARRDGADRVGYARRQAQAVAGGLSMWSCTIAVLALTAVANGAGAPSDLRAVLQKVTVGEAQAKTIKCSWVVKELIPKGSVELPDLTTGSPVATGLPERDTVLQGSITVVMDGHKAFYRETGQGYSATMNAVMEHDWTGTYVDGRGSALYGEGRGYIGRDSQVINLDYTPFMAAYRLFDPVLGKVKAEEARLVGRAEHEGHPCVVIESREGRIADRWWLAEDEDYCPVAWEQKQGDLPGCSASMEYERDEEAGLWRLKSWRLQIIINGALLKSHSGRVTQTKFNDPIPPGTFQIKFAPGTEVSNEFEMRTYVVDAEQDAAAEPTSPEAMDRFVEKVRKETAEPPAAATPKAPAEPKPAAMPRPVPPPAVAPPRELSPWAFVGGGALVVLILAAIYLSRRRAAA